MITPGNSREQLREYLCSLTSEKQAALLDNVERAILRGELVENADLVLAELRSAIRASSTKTQRVGSPSRRFFDPIEPFIVDGTPCRVMRGQIARTSLSPIWIWISRDLLPKEAKSYSDTVTRALGTNDKDAVAAHAEAFQAVAVPSIRKALASLKCRDWVRERLAAHLGSPRAMTDLREVVTVLASRHALSAVASKLPERIDALSGEHLATVRQALDEAVIDCDDTFIYALLLVMKRLSEPWQLVRLGANSGQAATSSHRLAVPLVIAHLENKRSELRTMMTSDEIGTIGDLVATIAKSLKGLGSELNLSEKSWAAQKLNAIRNDVHALLAAEIEAVPTIVTRLFDLTAPVEGAHRDPEVIAVAETERQIALFEISRTFEGPLSLDTKITSALSHMRHAMERAIAELLVLLRSGFDGVRNFCLVQISHAVRICTRLFGKKYASSIVAATNTAVDDKTAHGVTSIPRRAAD